MTIIRMGLSPRALGLSRPAAQRYWREDHASLFARIPHLVSYIQNHAVLDRNNEPLLGDPGFDIFSEVEFATTDDLADASSSSYLSNVIIPDELKLLDPDRRAFLMTHRQLLRGSPRNCSYKLVSFIAAGRQAISTTTANATSRLSYCDIAYPIDALRGWRCPPIDLVLQSFFDTAEQAYEAHHDGVHGAKDAPVIAVVVREFVVVPRQPSG